MRHELNLNGDWRFQPDMGGEGEAGRWFAADYNPRHWQTVRLPAPFDDCPPGLRAWEGTVWFRRRVQVPVDWTGRRIVLRFEAVNYHARVWVDGRQVGVNEDGFLPFEFDVTDLLKSGADGIIVVAADNRRRAGDVPGLKRGWRPFGGILREVKLLATDPLAVRNVQIRADADGALDIEASVLNARETSATCQLSAEVLASDGSTAAVLDSRRLPLAGGKTASVPMRASVKGARSWAPEDPVLYELVLRLSEDATARDEHRVRFGFRTIQATPEGLRLNGEPLFLTGFNRHEDSARSGPCPDAEQARADLTAIREAGGNFVRLCHYPHDPSTLHLCDEMGLLAMAEIPLYWWHGEADGKEASAQTLDAARRQLQRMIARDRNHPSVIFWSVSNETAEDRPEVVAGNAVLVRLARTLDPSRPAVHVSHQWPRNPHFEEDDVVCVNHYPSLGRRDAEGGRAFWQEELPRLRARYPHKPILITEFGHPSLQGVRGCLLGEHAQAAAIRAEAAGMHFDYVCGMTVWCLADHPWPEEPFVCRLTTSPYGVLTRDREPLPAYEAARDVFTARQATFRNRAP